jgi:U3 small nucleolar RNA-associated protein 13
MDQPRRLLKLFTEVLTDSSADTSSSFTGSPSVDAVLKSLSPLELRQMLLYVKDWNTVARTAEVAQAVLHAILKSHSADKVLECLEPKKPDEDEDATAFDEDEDDDEDHDVDAADAGKKRKSRRRPRPEMKAGDVLQALIPYTERHMTRTDKMVRESFIVEHLLIQMESLVGELDDEEMQVDA